MSAANNAKKISRSDADLGRMVISMAKAAQADAIVCATETGAFARHLHNLAEKFRVIAATTDAKTYEHLAQAGIETLRLPLRTADKYRQARHIISVALRARQIAIGDLVICSIGRDFYPEEGNIVVLTDVDKSIENLPVHELLKLTDGIRPRVLEAAIAVACRIGRAARRGKRLGTIFTLGDSLKVLEGATQLIPNPFQGHDDAIRRITNPEIYDTLIELSKLDGAFVVRGDGFIQTAGVFLSSPEVKVDVPRGLGARHMAAAAVTKRTDATAVVVAATDGNVRAFSEGSMVLQIDPDLPYGPITEED